MTILIATFAVGAFLLWRGLRATYGSGEFFMFCGLASLAAAILCTVAIPINHLGIRASIAEYREVQRSIDAGRKGEVSEVERAAILQTVTEWNAWRVSKQYWNDSIFDAWTPDEIDELEPME